MAAERQAAEQARGEASMEREADRLRAAMLQAEASREGLEARARRAEEGAREKEEAEVRVLKIRWGCFIEI